MLKKLGWLALLTSIVMIPFAGCGDDETTTPTPGPDVDVRNGTWSLTFTTYWTGPDTCVARGDTTDALPDTLLCSFDLVGQDTFDFDCTSSVEGEDVGFECTTLIRDIDPCKFIGHIEGTGTITDTTIALTASLWVNIQGPSDVCDLYLGLVDPCTEVVEITGVWLSDEGAEDCPEEDLNKTSVVRALLGRTAAREFADY